MKGDSYMNKDNENLYLENRRFYMQKKESDDHFPNDIVWRPCVHDLNIPKNLISIGGYKDANDTATEKSK